MGKLHTDDCKWTVGPDYACNCGAWGPIPTPAQRPSSEQRVTDPVTGGQKGSKPERFDLIPVSALEELARVYGEGAKKYEPNNWLRGYAWGLSFAAMMRHAWAWWRGEDADPETGLSHMAHVAWHAMTLMTFQRERLGTDDRWRNNG